MPLRLSPNNYLAVENELRSCIHKIENLQLKNKLQATINEMESSRLEFHRNHARADSTKIAELNAIFESGKKVLQDIETSIASVPSYESMQLSPNNYIFVMNKLRTSAVGTEDSVLKLKLHSAVDDMESMMTIFHDRYAYTNSPLKIKELNEIFENSQKALQEAKDYMPDKAPCITMSEIDLA